MEKLNDFVTNDLANIDAQWEITNKLINPSPFKRGSNHGLGTGFVWSGGLVKFDLPYPSASANFSEEGGEAIKGNLAYFVRNDEGPEAQFDLLVPEVAHGLTKAGLQSIEAFMYCVLGEQVNVRSSILGMSGRAQEVRREFLVLLEDVMKQPDLIKGVQRYQLAIEEAKMHLDLTASVLTWLMPSGMVINSESTVDCNK